MNSSSFYELSRERHLVVFSQLGQEGHMEWLHTHKYNGTLHAANLTEYTTHFIEERSHLDPRPGVVYDRVEASYRLEGL